MRTAPDNSPRHPLGPLSPSPAGGSVWTAWRFANRRHPAAWPTPRHARWRRPDLRPPLGIGRFQLPAAYKQLRTRRSPSRATWFGRCGDCERQKHHIMQGISRLIYVLSEISGVIAHAKLLQRIAYTWNKHCIIFFLERKKKWIKTLFSVYSKKKYTKIKIKCD